jgi:hypothetical protein
MQLVSVAEWLPSIPELADGARCKLTVEQLVAHQARHTVHLAEIQAQGDSDPSPPWQGRSESAGSG